MRVSIIIATYGEAHWEELAHARAAPSALMQDADEVLVGHDVDGTIADARNALAERAMGNWLLFLDADDELAPGYLDAMRRAWERESGTDGVPLLLTPAVQQIRKGRASGRADFFRECDLKLANWLVVGTMLERDLFLRVGGFEDYPHGFEDWSLWYKCARLGARVVRVRHAVYRMFVNPNSKHREGWKDRRWQVATHQRVQRELEAWVP